MPEESTIVCNPYCLRNCYIACDDDDDYVT